MAIAAQVLIALIALLHVYFVLLETVLFKTRGGVYSDVEPRGATTASWWRR